MLFLQLSFMATATVSAQEPEAQARNPIIWADVPDPSVIRVGDAYYMTSTTMHMSPGEPVMRSYNLVDWDIVSYAYEELAESNALMLENGQEAYGRGSWASSIRYRDGIFYVVTFSYTTGQTHLYRTADIESGIWAETTFNQVYHDPALFFEDDGRTFLVYGSGDLSIVELNASGTRVKEDGIDQELITDIGQVAGSGFIVAGEGAHVHKIGGMYYIFIITWPQGSMRTQVVYRSENLTGPYEGRVVLRDDGIAQGGLVETPEGDWYALLFGDRGAVGRIPYLVPVTWDDGWPVFGVNAQVPDMLDISSSGGDVPQIVASDEFDYGSDPRGAELALEWQWNHNPNSEGWSVTERPGYLRLTNRRLDGSFVETHNTLTQRTFGPQSAAKVALDVSEMEEGDYAGLGLLQENYGFVGVRAAGGAKSIVMVSGDSESYGAREVIPTTQDVVYLGVQADFANQADRADFYYSLDGDEWTRVGDALSMTYDLAHFMGYRFALFNYATEVTGGSADFDFFRVAPTFSDVSTDIADVGGAAIETDLRQNYPNPFRTSTEICYQVKQAADVRIEVFDVTGRRVRTLVDGFSVPGLHTVAFDASGLSSGVYVYRMQTGGRTTTRYMTAVQ